MPDTHPITDIDLHQISTARHLHPDDGAVS
jgi:hypothetical protein